MSSRKIYEKYWLYDLLRPVVDWNIKHSYRRIEVVGEENLPSDGSIILAPNHCNTLMDALVILRAYKGATVFGARADMFNNRFIARIMFFLRILPMVRQRDGLRNVLKNIETQDIIVETLENDVRFCIFPEGRHRAEKSLLPLGKGIFRAAIAANERFGQDKPVYIVPVGLDYGDFFRYRSTSLLTYGKPIDVTGFICSHPDENEARKMEVLRRMLAESMSKTFTYLKDDEYLKDKWTLLKILFVSSSERGYGCSRASLDEDSMRDRKLAEAIDSTLEERPEDMKVLLEKVKEFESFRRKDKISIYSFRKGNKPSLMFIELLKLLICLPYFVFSTAVSLPMLASEMLIRRRIKDKAFRNTASFGIKLGIGIIWSIVLMAVFFCTLSWPVAILLLAASVPTYSFAHDYVEGVRRFTSDIRLARCHKLKKRYTEIIRTFQEIQTLTIS